MISSLFHAILLTNMRMAIPLMFVLALTQILQKHIKSKLLYRMEKYVVIGICLSFLFTCFGPVVRITMPTLNLPLYFAQESFVPNITLPQYDFISKSDSNTTLNLHWEIVWISITGLFLLLLAYQNARIFFRLKYNSIAAPSRIINASEDICKNIKVKTPPAIFISNDIISPQTVGWIRPIIILPYDNFPEEVEKQRLLLLHELYHYKDKDNCWKFFVSLVVAACWFNPLVWILWNSFLIECELACDEKVLEKTSVEEKRRYLEMLIFFSDSEQAPKLAISLQSELGSSFRTMKLRVEQVAFAGPHYRVERFIYTFILVLLIPGIFNIHLRHGSALDISFVPEYIDGSNLGGYAKKSLASISTTKNSFQLPFSDATIFNMKNIDEDGNIYHNALYILASKSNEFVIAGYNGVVVAAQTKDLDELDGEELSLSSLGKYVIVDYGDGITVRYTFLSSITVQVGQTVSAGDILGVVGHTGASYNDIDQCGIYVMQDGVMVDPLLFFDIDVPVQTIP